MKIKEQLSILNVKNTNHSFKIKNQIRVNKDLTEFEIHFKGKTHSVFRDRRKGWYQEGATNRIPLSLFQAIAITISEKFNK